MSLFRTKSFLNAVCVATLSLSLAACAGGPAASNGVKERAEAKGGFMGLKTNDSVMATTEKAFQGTNQVVIGGFAVGFATYKTDSAKAGGGLMGNGFGGKSTAKSTLNGISTATMQSITDKAYANFVSDLKAKGYTVVDRSNLTNHEAFKSTNTLTSPFENSSGGLFGAKSKTVYVAPSSFGGIKPFMGDIAGETGGFGFSNPAMGAAKYAKEAGIKVINVVYIVDFANADSYGGWHRSSSAIEVGQGVTVVPEISRLSIWGGDGGTFSSANGSLRIGQPITSMKEFATVADSTTGADKTVQHLTNVIGVLGGIGSNSSREYVFDARPGDYSAAAYEAIGKANSQLTDKMAALK